MSSSFFPPITKLLIGRTARSASIRSIAKLTSTTKTWPNYDRSLINLFTYNVGMSFCPLWPYPQAFEFVVFMTQNRWYLRNSNVALFSYCCSLLNWETSTIHRLSLSALWVHYNCSSGPYFLKASHYGTMLSQF